MMIELDHNFVTVKAEAPTRVGRMTGLAETAKGEATLEALQLLGHGLSLKILMQM